MELPKKNHMILEYSPIQDVGHISFNWNYKKPKSNERILLGEFYGTMKQGNKELKKRITDYKKNTTKD